MLVATVWSMLCAEAAAGQFEMRNCLRGKIIHVLAYNENDKVRPSGVRMRRAWPTTGPRR